MFGCKKIRIRIWHEVLWKPPLHSVGSKGLSFGSCFAYLCWSVGNMEMAEVGSLHLQGHSTESQGRCTVFVSRAQLLNLMWVAGFWIWTLAVAVGGKGGFLRFYPGCEVVSVLRRVVVSPTCLGEAQLILLYCIRRGRVNVMLLLV